MLRQGEEVQVSEAPRSGDARRRARLARLARALATAVTMGGGGSKMPPEPVERTKPGVALGGKPRLCFVGMRPSHHAGCAKKVFDLITETGAL